MKLNKIAFAGALAGMLTATAATAAPGDPQEVGATSFGNVAITVTIPSLIRISDLTDIAFGTYVGAGDLTGNSDASVCTNGATTYGLVATSTNGGGAFELTGTGTNTDTIPYSVYWSGVDDGAVPPATPTLVALGEGANNAGLAVDDTSFGVGCVAETNKLTVTILEADLQVVSADDYDDTLVLTVTPE